MLQSGSNPLHWALPAHRRSHPSHGLDLPVSPFVARSLSPCIGSVADGIILDYARITGSVPIELGYGIAKSNPEVIVGAVRACGYATSKRQGLPPAVISLLYDPWIWKYSSAATPLDDPQRNPNSTLRVADEVAFFQQKISEVVAGIDAANKQLGYNCSVGAMYFDSEFFVWPGYEAGALPTPAYWADLGKKNEVMYNATRQALPHVPPGNIVYYARGSVRARPDLNATACAKNR